MGKKPYVLLVTQELIKRSREPTAEDKPWLKNLWFSLGCCVFSLCVITLTGPLPFSVGLLGGAVGTLIIVLFAFIIWRTKDVVKQTKNRK